MHRPKFLLSVVTASLLSCASSGYAAVDLRTIYDQALRNDPQWSAMQNSVKAEKEGVEKAKSRLLPNVGLAADITHAKVKQDYGDNSIFSLLSQLPGVDASGMSGGESTVNTKTAGIQAKQALFRMEDWYQYQKAKTMSSQADAQLEQEWRNFVLRVAETYLNELRAEDNLASVKSEEAAVLRQLEQTKQRFDVGLIAITDVHEAQAIADITKVNRLVAESQLSVAKESLETLTGNPQPQVATLGADFPVVIPQPNSLEQWVELAKQKSSALKAAELASSAASKNLQQAKAAYYPTVDLVAGYSKADNANYSEGTDSTIKSIGLQFNMPLYTGGAVSAGTREARYREAEAKDNFDYTHRTVMQNTKNLFRIVTMDVDRVAARKQAITSSDSALKATRAGYEVGTRNIVEVLQAERQLYAAERDYANSRYDYVVDSIRLKAVTGVLSAQDIDDINKWTK